MTDRILLPAGMLPPGEWAVGSRVSILQTPGSWFLLPSHKTGNWYTAHEDRPHDPWDHPASVLRLDITHGPLDFATRALWHALELGEQPLTAPGWAVHNGSGCWALSRRSMLVHASRVGYHAEPDPRRALRLACEAVVAALEAAG